MKKKMFVLCAILVILVLVVACKFQTIAGWLGIGKTAEPETVETAPEVVEETADPEVEIITESNNP